MITITLSDIQNNKNGIADRLHAEAEKAVMLPQKYDWALGGVFVDLTTGEVFSRPWNMKREYNCDGVILVSAFGCNDIDELYPLWLEKYELVDTKEELQRFIRAYDFGHNVDQDIQSQAFAERFAAAVESYNRWHN